MLIRNMFRLMGPEWGDSGSGFGCGGDCVASGSFSTSYCDDGDGGADGGESAAGDGGEGEQKPEADPAKASPQAAKPPAAEPKAGDDVQALLAEMRAEREALKAEREALVAEREATVKWRETEIATERRELVRGWGLSVDMTDGDLDAVLPKVDPRTEAGKKALKDWREKRASYFKAPTAPPKADPTKMVETLGTKGSRLAGQAAVSRALRIVHGGER